MGEITMMIPTSGTAAWEFAPVVAKQQDLVYFTALNMFGNAVSGFNDYRYQAGLLIYHKKYDTCASV